MLEMIACTKSEIAKKELTISAALEGAKEKRLNLERTKEELADLVFSIAEKYKEGFDFKINKMFLRKMKTKWGSYSSKGNLTVNPLLKYLPDALIEYVIFHEMVHSLERKHNERFWKIIGKKYKDYPTNEKDLLVYWFLMQKENYFQKRRVEVV